MFWKQFCLLQDLHSLQLSPSLYPPHRCCQCHRHHHSHQPRQLMKVLLRQRQKSSMLFCNTLQRPFEEPVSFFPAISLCFPSISSPSLWLSLDYFDRYTPTLTQSPKWELFKDVIGSAQCKLRKEPIGCRLNILWARLSEKKKSYADFFWQIHNTAAKTTVLSTN